jgi:hypothetical protein
MHGVKRESNFSISTKGNLSPTLPSPYIQVTTESGEAG